MQIRVANAADAPAIAHIQVVAWQAAYRGQLPDAILDGLDVQHRAVRWQEILSQPQGMTFVAEIDTGTVGFINLIPTRDEDVAEKRIAEITSIYIQPNHWREGFGRALCLRAIEEAGKRGFTEVTLWVLKTNLAATGFYQAIGLVLDGATKVEKYRDFELHEVRMRLHL